MCVAGGDGVGVSGALLCFVVIGVFGVLLIEWEMMQMYRCCVFDD